MAGCLEHNNTKDLCPYDVINVKARHMQVDPALNFLTELETVQGEFIHKAQATMGCVIRIARD
jgi:hypothetical protein